MEKNKRKASYFSPPSFGPSLAIVQWDTGQILTIIVQYVPKSSFPGKVSEIPNFNLGNLKQPDPGSIDRDDGRLKAPFPAY
jgi:hypothetical protein